MKPWRDRLDDYRRESRRIWKDEHRLPTPVREPLVWVVDKVLHLRDWWKGPPVRKIKRPWWE